MPFHIFVIEDDPTIQELYRLLFENEGYSVTLVPTLDQASTDLTALRTDLIILDVLINGKQNGWFFVQSLKKEPQTATIPLLVVTALAARNFDAEGKKYMQSQAIPVLFKPFDIDELLATIHMLLSHASHSSSRGSSDGSNT